MNGLASFRTATDGPGRGGYTVASGRVSDQLGVGEHQALADVIDRAMDPREVDTLPLERRVAQFRPRAPLPYVSRPGGPLLRGEALKGRVEGALAKLEGARSPELAALKLELGVIVAAHQRIDHVRIGGRR